MRAGYERMRQEILMFPELLEKGLTAARDVTFEPRPIRDVVWVGMGASALVGDYVSTYFELLREFEGIETPRVRVVRSHRIPRRADLYVIYSYSGETTETLLAAVQAFRVSSNVLCFSKGGTLEKLARKHGVVHVKLIPGLQSRSHVPYGLAASLIILSRVCEIEDRVSEELRAASKLVRERTNEAERWAKETAKEMQSRIPLVVAPDILQPVLTRASAQFSENAKTACLTTPLPEGLHNVFSILPQASDLLHGIVLEVPVDKEYECYLNATRSLLERFSAPLTCVRLDWRPSIEPLVLATFYIDMLSLELARERGVDPLEIPIVSDVRKAMRERLLARMTLPSPEHTRRSPAP